MLMATEKRLIDANFLDDRCRRQIADEWNKKVAPVSWSEAYKEFLDDVWDAPTVDAVEVAHGRWEQVQRWATKAKYRCSVCGREIMSAVKVNIEKYPHCHCGAKMDGGTYGSN
jgi:DNA-directed RNA polymerase subunit RPC12/RpoP